MGLMSFIRREIKVEQELLLTAEFYRLPNLLPFLAFTNEELLVIKRAFTREEAEWLLDYKGDCKIITAEPVNYEDLSVLEALEKELQVERAESVGMNYIHGGETLLVFSDDVNSGKEPSAANMVKLYPVRKKDIEVTLRILLKDAGVSEEESQGDAEAADNVDSAANETAKQSEPEDSSKESLRKKLVRDKLKRLFDEGYSVVNIRLDGSAAEQRTIALTEFYKRQNIAQGRLVGSWRVFEKGQLKDVMDAGIAKRALDNVLKKYTINISNYGRIVRNDHLKELIAAVENIEQEYIAYLKGENHKSIGGVEIKVQFNPAPALEKTFNELEEYLRCLQVPGGEAALIKYQNAVSDFLQREYLGIGDFVSKVRLRTTQLTFKDEQWKNPEFIYAVEKAVLSSPEFFDAPFCEMLALYIKPE